MDPTKLARWQARFLALVMWLPFSVLFLVIGLLGDRPGWWIALGVTLPVVMGFVFAAFAGRGVITSEGPYGITSEGAHTEGHLRLALPVVQVGRVVNDAVDALPRFSMVKLSADGAEIKTRVSMFSSGERIALRFRPLEEAQTDVEATCEPRLATVMIDFGYSAKVLRTLLEAIEQRTTRDEHAT